MSPNNPIREIVQKFLDQPNDLESFLSAFSDASFNIHKNGGSAAVKLADQVEGCLADVRAGFASIPELHKALRELLAPPAVGYSYVSVTSFSNSVNQPAVVERGFPAASSDTLAAKEFGSIRPVQA
jgi:hypothetical protein